MIFRLENVMTHPFLAIMIIVVDTPLVPEVACVLHRKSFSLYKCENACVLHPYDCDNDQRNASPTVSSHCLPLKKPSL